MTKLLIEGCEVIATMDDRGTEIDGGSILIDGGLVSWVGSGRPPGAEGARRIDGRGCVALQGLVNAHHHLYQVLTRVRAQSQGLFGWLRELYPVWASVDGDWERAAASVGLAELAPGKPVTVVVRHADGSSREIRTTHTMSDEHIEWFRAGSALNVLRQQS